MGEMAVSEFNSIICAKINVKALDRKIRVGAVSYLNTKPLLYGIERDAIMDDIELIIDYPARIATMLLEDRIDMGLVPVAILLVGGWAAWLPRGAQTWGVLLVGLGLLALNAYTLLRVLVPGFAPIA